MHTEKDFFPTNYYHRNEDIKTIKPIIILTYIHSMKPRKQWSLSFDVVDSESDDSSDHDQDEKKFITPSPKRRKAFDRELTPVQMDSMDESKVEIDPRAFNYEHPDVCCKKMRCYQHFEAESMRRLRRRVYTDYREDFRRRKVEIARLKSETLLVDGKQCCTKFFMAVFGVSTTYIYGDNRRRPRQRMAPVAEAIITFFKQMRLENDAMPDKMEYQLYAMKKKEVFRWYHNTAQEHQKCSISYFYVQWAEHASDCKLRRCLRFAKCQECQDLRQVGQ